ncbi:glycosyltransferase family 4 protein [Streptomyces sp. 4.24]
MVANQSGRRGGGIPVVCMHMCAALSQLGHQVTLLAASVDSEGEHGDTTVAPSRSPAFDRLKAEITSVGPGAGAHEERHAWAARMPDTVKILETAVDTLTREDLGMAEKEFDLVIGHTRFSGRAAVNIRNKWYPKARYAHIVHTSPRGIQRGGTKDRWKAEEESGIERDIMRRSDLVVGVGPLLSAEVRRQGNAVPGSYGTHEIVPAFEGPDVLLPPKATETGRLVLYLAGRADDRLKGVAEITQAISVARKRLPGVDLRLNVRGIPDGPERQAFQAEMDEITGQAGVVRILPYTSDKAELERDKVEADAAVMPSTHEGFGMSASEAAAMGLPVLTTSDSGMSMFLGDSRRFPPGTADQGVVPDRNTDRVEAWAQAIAKLYRELAVRQPGARGLAELLKGYSWRSAAASLVQAAGSPSQHGYTTQSGTGTNQYQPNELSNLAARAVRRKITDRAQETTATKRRKVSAPEM